MKPSSRSKLSLPSWQSRGATPESRLPCARGGPSSAIGGFHQHLNLTLGCGLQILNLQLVIGAKQRRAAFQNRYLVHPTPSYTDLPQPSPSSSGGPAVDRAADRGSADLSKMMAAVAATLKSCIGLVPFGSSSDLTVNLAMRALRLGFA